MELLDALSQTFDHANKIVAGINPDQLGASTPCREWDVRALLSHMIGAINNIGRGARGDELLADMNAFVLKPDLDAQFRSETDRTLTSWKARGTDGEVNIGAGPMPASIGIGINLVDTATHSWDVAKATGQDGALPDPLAATILTVAQGFITDQVRTFAGFDQPVKLAANASPTDQLVAFLGRQP